MTRKPKNELAAGIFVLAGLAAILGVALWLGSARLFEKPAATAVFYTNLADGSSGLREGNPVKIGALPVGKIVGLRLDPVNKRTLYYAAMNSAGVRLRANGSAAVVTAFVGDSELTVTDMGDANAPLVDEAHPMRIVGGMSEMMGSVSRTVRNLETASGRIAHELDSNYPGSILGDIRSELDASREGSLMADIKHVVQHVNRIAESVVEIANQIRGQTDANQASSFMARLSQSVSTFRDILGDAQPKVARTLANVSDASGAIRRYADANLGELLVRVHDISGEVLKTARNFAAISEKARAIVDRNSPAVDEMAQNFALTSANLKATAAEVRRNPWRLLYKPDEKELNSANILEAARAFTAGAEQLDETVLRLKTIDPNAAGPEELKKIRDQLQRTFEKFNKAEQGLLKELEKDK
jgi:ABC-type transporter Mla subunit MlaD